MGWNYIYDPKKLESLMLSQVYFRVNLRIDFLPATIIMRIENIFSLSVSDATLPKPTLEIIKVIKQEDGDDCGAIHLVMQVIV